MSKNVSVKATEEKLITVNADKDLFGRLLVGANAQQINLREVLSYELSPVACSWAHQDRSLRKTAKSTLCSILEKNVTVLPRLPVLTSDTVYIIDGMALVQRMKYGGGGTFGELSLKYYRAITQPLSQQNCNEVHVVFDHYWETSIKNNKRSRRGASTALKVKICSNATPIPKQWDKYISNCKNKTNLCNFVSTSFCHTGQEKLPENKKIIIGGGFRDERKGLSISRGTCSDIPGLQSNHEEADTHLLLHAKCASENAVRIVIQSPDTDVLVICTSHFHSLRVPNRRKGPVTICSRA